MSWEAQEGVWAHSKAKGNTLLTLLAIANHLNRESHLAWPSVATLATRTRQCERNVRYALKNLRESGEITVIDGMGPGGSNCYTINLPYRGRPDSIPLQNLHPAKISGGQDTTQTPARIAPNPFNQIELGVEDDKVSDVVQSELELWPRVLDRVRERIPKETFTAWLERTQLRRFEKGHLVVIVPTPRAADFLNTRIMPLIQEAASQETGESCTVAFEVA